MNKAVFKFKALQTAFLSIMMKYLVIVSFCNIAATHGWSFGFRTASSIPQWPIKRFFTVSSCHYISVINYSVMNYYIAREVECLAGESFVILANHQRFTKLKPLAVAPFG